MFVKIYESVNTCPIPTFLTTAEIKVNTNNNTIETIDIIGFLVITHKDDNKITKSAISKTNKGIAMFIISKINFAIQVTVQINKKQSVFFSNIFNCGEIIFNTK